MAITFSLHFTILSNMATQCNLALTLTYLIVTWILISAYCLSTAAAAG